FFGLEGTGPVGIEVKKVLGDCVEIDNKSSDQYWSHGRLGSIGLKYGASMILAHLKEAPSGGGYTLNVANTGLGDAILCHGSQVTTLTVPHNPATNRDEVRLVVKEKGFISE
uniref:Uncharacterized protein n=1 Tax=Amphimedon queenslandica TaxID=400682 RepID=A0A1X7U6N2_AMPQE